MPPLTPGNVPLTLPHLSEADLRVELDRLNRSMVDLSTREKMKMELLQHLMRTGAARGARMMT
jgi:hypothetical protein